MCKEGICSGMCKKGHCTPAVVGKILVIVGGVNWGLVGLGMLLGSMSSWNLVGMIFGSMPVVEAIVYLLVGISAVMMIFGCKCGKCKEMCKDGTCGHCEGSDANKGAGTM